MRNKPPVVLVDMDDVLVNTLERWVYELDRNYHLNYTCEDVKHDKGVRRTYADADIFRAR